MRKLIFLLLMTVILTGFVSAIDTAHPPEVLNFEAVLYGDSADNCAVTPDTVLVEVLPVTVEPISFQADMENYKEIAIRPDGAIPDINTGQFWAKPAAGKTIAETDPYLRC